MSKVWVGLTGFPRSGKDLAADWLQNERDYTKISFAEPLRALAWRANPIVGIGTTPTGGKQYFHYREAIEVYGYDEAKKELPLFREFLDGLGDGARGVFGDDVWVEQALDTFERRNEESGGLWISPVFSDVRYDNEAEMILENGGIIIQLIRPGSVAPNSNAVHSGLSSENITYTIANMGTLEELYTNLDYLLGRHV